MRALTLALLMLATPALAQHPDYVQIWTDALRAEGYSEIEVERTWLGRIKIEAERGREEREIILNRSTGEVLRDYTETEDGEYVLPYFRGDD